MAGGLGKTWFCSTSTLFAPPPLFFYQDSLAILDNKTKLESYDTIVIGITCTWPKRTERLGCLGGKNPRVSNVQQTKLKALVPKPIAIYFYCCFFLLF